MKDYDDDFEEDDDEEDEDDNDEEGKSAGKKEEVSHSPSKLSPALSHADTTRSVVWKQ